MTPFIPPRIRTPSEVQALIDLFTFNQGKRLSPADVLLQKQADCLEGATTACAILLHHNIPSFLIDFRTVRDEDHILCVYEQNGKYGAIAQSKFLGLRHRNPVYANIRELALSYFQHYFNYYGEYTLREYSDPFHLHTRTDGWRTDASAMHRIEEEIDSIPHHKLHDNLPKLPRVSYEQFWADVKIIPKGQKIGKQYQKR